MEMIDLNRTLHRLKNMVFDMKFIYILFVCSLMFKLYLFAAGNGVMFWTMGSLISLGAILILSGWTWLLRKNAQFISLLMINLFITALIYSDLIYFRYFEDFISLNIIAQSAQVGALGGSILELMSWIDLVYFVDLLLVLSTAYWWWRWEIRPTMKIWWKRLISAGVLTLVGIFICYALITSYLDRVGNNLFTGNWWNVSVYNVTGLIGFHVLDAKRFWDETFNDPEPLPPAEISKVQSLFQEIRNAGKAKQLPYFGAAKGKNLLVVQLESFQNFVMNKKINGVEITPNLNRLIREDVAYFDRFHHQVGQGRTADAEFIVNQSLHPLPSGSVYFKHPGNEFDSLPEILKGKNYRTGAFHSYRKSFWNRQIMYENIGFDRFYSIDDFKQDEIVGWSLSDRSFFRQSLEYIEQGNKQNNQPFYAFMVALSSHHPYTNVPQKYKKIKIDSNVSQVFADYIHAVHYVDYAVGTLIEELKQRKLWDNTLLVMYGDHDSGIRLQGADAAKVGETDTPFNAEWQKYRVPLFIHLPQSNLRGTRSQVIGQIDLLPTMLYLLGVGDSDYYHMGGNILDDRGGLVVFRNGSSIDSQFFYKASLDGDFNKATCYDVKTEKVTDLAKCRPQAIEADRRLKFSDRTLRFNLIKQFKEESGRQ